MVVFTVQPATFATMPSATMSSPSITGAPTSQNDATNPVSTASKVGQKLSRSNTSLITGLRSNSDVSMNIPPKDTRPSKLISRPSATQASNAAPASITTIPSEEAENTEAAIDPLSRHILKRTKTESLIPQHLRSDAEPGPSDGAPAPPSRKSTDLISSRGEGSILPPGILRGSKDNKKKGVSFLSRFIGGKKKDSLDDEDEDEITNGDNRIAGADAEIFSQPTGFTPRFPAPPKYIRVKAQNKKEKDFDRVFLAQELRCHGDKATAAKSSSGTAGKRSINNGDAIWAMEFSKDGKYLAAAGQDRMVRVWAVISSEEDRLAHEKDEDSFDGNHLNAPVFKTKPIMEYEGHSSSVLDLSWSKNNFLLSSSMDKTVRLWHISRPECLCCFKHHDFVTSISFHPRDDRFFLAGSLDSKLRLWSIPDKSVAYVVNVPDMVTAVAFTPNGKTAMAGTLNGHCLFYETESLKLSSQIHVRSARGKNAKGSKITGIDATGSTEEGNVRILITSNDSRVRLYNFKDKAIEAKFRGNENTCSQIHATFSDDGKYVICGSEDKKAYIWPLQATEKDVEKRPVEIFEAHAAIVTTAIMAPAATKRLLSCSGDPLYDLCNPPPVTLLSKAESMISSRAPTENGQPDESAGTPRKSDAPKTSKAEESPVWLAKSCHPGGNIICTADYQGVLKIFRQDCAYSKRRQDMWETGSTLSKKLLKRSASVATRASRNSNRNSIASFRNEHLIKNSSTDHHILNWRKSISGTHNTSMDSIRPALAVGSTRSQSPGISTGQHSGRSSPPKRSRAPGHRAGSSDNGSHLRPIATPSASPPSSIPRTSSDDRIAANGKERAQSPQIKPSDRLETVQDLASNDKDPLVLRGGQSFMFWSKSAAAAKSAAQARAAHNDLLDPEALMRKESLVSSLSSDVTSEASAEEDELACTKCGSRSFRAAKSRSGQRLICGKCGEVA